MRTRHFSCTARSYRYFFHADSLNLAAMQAAADQLVGSHDFRNFCKIDPTMSSHFTRKLTSIQVKACEQVPEDCVQATAPWPCSQAAWREDALNSSGGRDVDEEVDKAAVAVATANAYGRGANLPLTAAAALHPDILCELLIHGNAFLYHQVRCMAAVLFLIGRGVEDVSLVARLLDVQATPNKPQYAMAPEQPLVLYDTCFPALPLTPGFDYQTRPATRPQDNMSFVDKQQRRHSSSSSSRHSRRQLVHHQRLTILILLLLLLLQQTRICLTQQPPQLQARPLRCLPLRSLLLQMLQLLTLLVLLQRLRLQLLPLLLLLPPAASSR